MALPGWPDADAILKAGSQLPGSQHGSRRGSRHGSQHGAGTYAHFLQMSRTSNTSMTDGQFERQSSRRLEKEHAGDYDQDHAGEYPVENDKQAQLDSKTKTQDYNPEQMVSLYFQKWQGGVDTVSSPTSLASLFDFEQKIS